MDDKLYRLILAGLISVAPCSLSFAQTATGALGLSMEVVARVQLGSGGSTPIRVTDEGTLRTGDELQIRLNVQRDAYVYVIAYGSSQSGLLLHPFSGNAVDAFVRAGEERIIPGPDRYLPLDRQLGRESIYAVASQRPVTTLSSLLVRMEAHGDDRAAIMATVRSSFPELAGVSFHHVDNAPLIGVPSSARSAGATKPVVSLDQPGGSVATSPIVGGIGAPASATSGTGATVFEAYEEPGVLSAEGSRIAAAVDGIEPPPAPRRTAETAADLPTTPESASQVTEPAATPEPSRKSPGLVSRLGRFFGFGRRRDEASSADGAADTPEPGPEPVPATTFALPGGRGAGGDDLALSADAGSGAAQGATAAAPLALPPGPDTMEPPSETAASAATDAGSTGSAVLRQSRSMVEEPRAGSMDPELNVEALDSVFASLSEGVSKDPESLVPDTVPETSTFTAEEPPETAIDPAPGTVQATSADVETPKVREESALLGAFKSIFGGGKSNTAKDDEAAVGGGRDAVAALDTQPDTEAPAVETEPVVEAEEAPKGGFFSRLGRSLFGGQKSQRAPAPDTDSATSAAGAAPDPEPQTAFETVTRADGEQVVILEGPPRRPAAPAQTSGVLGGEGSKIRALLAGEEVQPLEPNVVTAAGAQASTSSVPAAPPAAETLTAAASSPGAEAATEASVFPDQVQAALASGAAASARPPAETLAALTSPMPAPAAPIEPVADIDMNADDNVASAIVLVVTPTGTGSGVLLDNAGHVLANWHVVTGYPTVSVSFKAPDEGVASAERTYSARVIRLNKSADLALLRIDDVRVDVTPVRFADVNQIRAGDVLHAIGHPADGTWSHTLGKISKVKPGSSWYAGRHLLHRGTVIQAKVLDDPGSAGAPLFNNRLELVGISAMRKTKKGVLIGVSVDTIRRFLDAAPAQAAMSAGG